MYMLAFLKRNFWKNLLLILVVTLQACGGSSGSKNPESTTPPTGGNTPVDFDGSSPTGKATLSGTIKQFTGSPLAGATISIKGTSKTAVTNEAGVFVIPEMTTGNFVVEIDGSTATGDAGTQYGTLNIFATIGSNPQASLDKVIILPDLNSVDTAADIVIASIGTIVSGIVATQGDITLTSNGATVSVQLGGVDAEGELKISATPVPLPNLPMALPATSGSAAANFVTIQPANATFSPPLDLTLPNDQGLPAGTLVDIFAFDHDLETWVNLSIQSVVPNYGVVSMDGSVIVATGIISKGGWNGPVVSADYVEIVIGTVTDGTNPLEGVFVFATTGQSGLTDAAGKFSIEIPVFGAIATPPIMLTITTPVSLGGVNVTTATINAANDGIPIDFGTTTLTIPSTGVLSGTTLNIGAPSTAVLTLTGTANSVSITPNADGSFFLADLAPGEYTLSTFYNGDLIATTTTFMIVAGKVTVVLLERNTGNNVSVKVFLVPDFKLATAITADAGTHKATVTLSQGNTVLSQDTDINGVATFANIVGPFTVTGQHDFPAVAGSQSIGTQRVATTLHNIDPANRQVGLTLDYAGSFPFIFPEPNTSIDGVLKNIPFIPATHELVVFAKSNADILCCSPYTAIAFVMDGQDAKPADMPYSITGDLGAGEYTLVAVIRYTSLNGTSELPTNYLAGAVYPASVPTIVGTFTPNYDIDFDDPAMKIGFADKTVTVNNYNADPVNSQIVMGNNILLPSSIEIFLRNYDDSSSLAGGPGPILPVTGSFVSSAPTGSAIRYSFRNRSSAITLIDNDVFVPFTTAQNIEFNMIANVIEPQLLTPGDGQVFTVADAMQLSSSWISNTSNPSLISVSLFAGAGAAINVPNVSDIVWKHVLAGDATSMTLPPVAATLPMFGPGTRYSFEMSVEKYSRAFDFNFFYNFDVIANKENTINGGAISTAYSGRANIRTAR